ncbi:hypothetical protein SAMN04488156_1251, partial [Bacillus sp. 166amftsu]
KTKLAELGVNLPEKGKRGEMFANLDDQTKEKAKAIMKQKKAGTLTREQVKEKLAELGVNLPEKGKREEMFANLDDQTKEKAKAIIDKAKAQLAELGVDFPIKDHKFSMKKASN